MLIHKALESVPTTHLKNSRLVITSKFFLSKGRKSYKSTYPHRVINNENPAILNFADAANTERHLSFSAYTGGL